MSQEQAEHQPPKGTAIMISYRELVELRTGMATLNAKLDAALALKGDVDALKDRMRDVELQLATAKGQATGGGLVMRIAWQGLVALAAAVIGAVGGKHLPF